MGRCAGEMKAEDGGQQRDGRGEAPRLRAEAIEALEFGEERAPGGQRIDDAEPEDAQIGFAEDEGRNEQLELSGEDGP